MAKSERPQGELAIGKRQPAPSPKPSARRVLLERLLKTALTFTAVGAVLGSLGVALVINHYERGLPSVEELRGGYAPPQVTRVFARNGTLLASLFTERRTVVPFSEVPDHVKQAFLAAEDASFYEHEGLDYLGMLRALVANLRAGRTTQGGSTITQQVVKNVLLDSERSYRRKIRETILARRLEQRLTKDEILGLYLNHIYLGHGRYGVEEASRYYFGKGISQANVAEGALLAGIVAAPERFSPRRSMDRALERRRYVLGQMLNKGFMTERLHGEALILPLELSPGVEAESELAPEVVGEVKRVLADFSDDNRRGGFNVHTTIDPAWQVAARAAIRHNLDRYAERQKLQPPFTLEERRLWGKAFVGTPRKHGIYVGKVHAIDDANQTIDVNVGTHLGRVKLALEERYNPKRLPPSAFTREGAALRVGVLEAPGQSPGPLPLRLELGPQSAMVVLDTASGELRAIVGSYESIMGGLDRSGLGATQGSTLSKRQPGSAFKPLFYSYALESRKFTAASPFELEPETANQPAKVILLREGVARSNNQVAEAVLSELGAQNVVDWAHQLGIRSRLGATPSLALGAYEVSVLELAGAYMTIAAAGRYREPRLFSKATAPGGGAVGLPSPAPPKQVMSREAAYLMTNILESVVEQGTARRARSLGRPVAGKTGTTNKNRDAWFVGYTTDIVVACWVGYDDGLPLGWGESGSATALPAFMEFVKTTQAKRPHTQFARPPGLVTTAIDPATGLLPYPGQTDTVQEVFLPGTLPSDGAEPREDADARPNGEGGAHL